jgi:nucleotide-binding universal stress UspA family protein
VVAGVDGSDAGAAALRAAATLTRASGAPLLAVHVIGPSAGRGTARPVRERVERELREAGVAGTFVTRAGDPAIELERAARAADAQVLVIGEAPAGGGTVGERLRRRARVPLLVVHAALPVAWVDREGAAPAAAPAEPGTG